MALLEKAGVFCYSVRIMSKLLTIRDLQVDIGDANILRGVDMDISPGEIHIVMGPNGSGKSTLANAIMGHYACDIRGGEIIFDGQNLSGRKPEERSDLGIFLAFQSPREIQGIQADEVLFEASKKRGPCRSYASVFELREELARQASALQLNADLVSRSLNVGFSGGEKKKMEMLQLSILKPRLALLDEIDSGLDIDSLKTISRQINEFAGEGGSALIITHYQRIVEYLDVGAVHVMLEGKIVRSGNKDMVGLIEEKGYRNFT